MHVQINITDDDIAYAESILLSNKKKGFDDERRTFIKNMDTIDLQAVPGSGKTTALLAKLLILERYLPFPNGSGILVLSHTNVAVDKIKNEIGMYCPKLFTFPNFVGTIQSFVDHFLAIPCYLHWFKEKPYRIDNEIYFEKVKKFFDNGKNLANFTQNENKNARHFLRVNEEILYSSRLKRDNSQLKLVNKINGTEVVITKPKNKKSSYLLTGLAVMRKL